MQINIKLEGVDQAMKQYDRALVERAARLAINDAARSARPEASREIRKKWNITAGRVNGELKNVKFASLSDLTAIIQAKGRPISLLHFGAKWVRGTRVESAKGVKQTKRVGRNQGVSVKILRGKTTRLPNAFVARVAAGKSGGTFQGIFERMTSKRLPIEHKSTITIASMFGQEPVQQATAKTAAKTWRARFIHHITRLLK